MQKIPPASPEVVQHLLGAFRQWSGPENVSLITNEERPRIVIKYQSAEFRAWFGETLKHPNYQNLGRFAVTFDKQPGVGR
jgi:hypothetical protein